MFKISVKKTGTNSLVRTELCEWGKVLPSVNGGDGRIFLCSPEETYAETGLHRMLDKH
jgi:hypothetical protein